MRVRGKIGTGFGVMIVLLIALSTIGILQLNSVVKAYQTDVVRAKQIETLAESIKANLLESQRFERDFSADKDTSLTSKVLSRLKDAGREIDTVRQLVAEQQMLTLLDSMSAGIHNYQAGFRRLEQMTIDRGLNENLGAQGVFRDAAHEVEGMANELNDTEYMVLYLELRRHEKDYMLRGSQKYIDKAYGVLDKMKAPSAIPGNNKRKVIQLLDNYRSAFDRMTLLDRQLAVASSQIEHDVNATIDHADQLTVMAKAEARQAAQDIRKVTSTSTLTLLILGLFAIAFGVLAAVFLARIITRPLKSIVEVADEVALGNLDKRITVNQKDEIGDLANSFRQLLAGLRNKADAAVEIAKGNLGVEIDVASDKDKLGRSMVQMRETILALIEATQDLINSVNRGDLKARGTDEGFEGAWLNLIQGMNGVVDGFVGPIQLTSNYIADISLGKIPETITEEYQGDFNTIKNNLNNLVEVMQNLVQETGQLIHDSRDGKLDVRGNAGRFDGSWAELVEGINGILDAVITPVKEAQHILENMADGDLSKKMEGDYKGDHAAIKNALNGTIDSLNGILRQVTVAVDQVTSGAEQVSSASQSLSQGATQQASGLEEVSSSMTQVGSQTRLNAENAQQATHLSESASQAANQGNQFMAELLAAMKDINAQSAEVQKIVKAIDEIAFQTNLLALNAAVEAARAGAHGKGFAVVAEEVRNLAQRSANAAKETTDLIEGNVAAVANGGKISEQTAAALQEILTGSTKVKDLVNEIASASREQSQAVEQINQALDQIDQVTQSNTSSAEESAAAAEELAGQADQLKQMVGHFRLDASNLSLRGSQRAPRRLGAGSNGGKGEAQTTGRQPSTTRNVSPEDVIRLDDADFSEF